jgi:hypothetical protein
MTLPEHQTTPNIPIQLPAFCKVRCLGIGKTGKATKKLAMHIQALFFPASLRHLADFNRFQGKVFKSFPSAPGQAFSFCM